jgi:hypothetical protein
MMLGLNLDRLSHTSKLLKLGAALLRVVWFSLKFSLAKEHRDSARNGCLLSYSAVSQSDQDF